MTKLTLLCWQEIPSVVEAKDKNGVHKVELSLKFQELIDLVAMKRGLGGSDEYLMHWNKRPRPEVELGAPEAAQALAAEIEADYARIKADAIANS